MKSQLDNRKTPLDNQLAGGRLSATKCRESWPDSALKNLPAYQNGILDLHFLRFDLSLRDLIAPDGESSVYIQGAAGAGAARILLTTDATTLYFIDHAGLSKRSLESALQHQNWGSRYQHHKEYLKHKFDFGFALATGEPHDVAKCLLSELEAIGVEKRSIRIASEPLSEALIIKFAWASPGRASKERTIVYIRADLLDDSHHIDTIKRLEPRGVDGYYQIAAYDLLNCADQYLPPMLSLIRPNGLALLDTNVHMRGRVKYPKSEIFRNSNRDTVNLMMAPEFSTLRSQKRSLLDVYGRAVIPYRVL